MTEPVPTLDIQNLSITYGAGEGALKAVRDVSFQILPGEAYGLIGESGSGKSSVAYAVMRYLSGGQAEGRVSIGGRDVMAMPQSELVATRGRLAAMVYQDPMSSLNPVIKIGEQIAEVIRRHRGVGKRDAWRRSVELLGLVHLPAPVQIAHRYPHQLSGGQQQRVVIAMAIAADPMLLIMDEPTTGLDVTTEAVILDLINELRRTVQVSVLFISHNVAVVAQICDRVGVLYAGTLVEEGPTQQVLRAPQHPYTIGLMNALPGLGSHRRRLSAIPGRLPDLRAVPGGCIFNARCTSAAEHPCQTLSPPLKAVTPGHYSRCHFEIGALAARIDAGDDAPSPQSPDAGGRKRRLEIVAVRKVFGRHRGFRLGRAKTPVVAVDSATLSVPPGRTLAVVGESGSGKSTLARCVAGLILPDVGDIRLEDDVLPADVRSRNRAQQQAIQMVFQNPEASLNPHWTVEQIVGRPLQLYGKGLDRPALRHKVIELLEAVKLGERYLSRYPREISGGEKQRVSIARAFAGGPRLVICDEPTSALDVSVQAAILNELLALQEQYGTSYLFISHDLGVVRHIADQVAIMQKGEIVEIGEPAQVFDHPEHPYTRALIAAIPTLDPKRRPTTADHDHKRQTVALSPTSTIISPADFATKQTSGSVGSMTASSGS
jgi:peptide/nickel transport system ATP-binding protein